MNCYCCDGEAKRFGFYRNKNLTVQRYQCLRCGKSFSEKQPLDGLRVDYKVAAQAINMLCEGMGVRAVARLTRMHRDTVLSILETIGPKCQELLDEKVQNVKVSEVQVDEIWGFVGCKPPNNEDDDPERGEFFTYLSVDPASKLIINSHTSKRNKENTLLFIRNLRNRVTTDRFQLTSDAYGSYWRGNGAVQQVFGNNVDYATETKLFGRPTSDLPPWKRPLTVTGIKRKPRIGTPNMDLATTCHAERTNLSVRTFTRRFTRATLGFSKSLENHKHAIALFIAHFNFCRVHSAHGKTPARAAGLTDHTWTIEEMIGTSV